MRHLHIPIYQKIVQLRCWLVLSNNLLIFCVLFLSKGSVLKITTKFCVPFFMFSKIIACVLVFPCTLLYTLSCDIESNPGPIGKCKEYFSISHWNLNLPIYILNYFFRNHILYFINLISFVYQRLILIF